MHTAIAANQTLSSARGGTGSRNCCAQPAASPLRLDSRLPARAAKRACALHSFTPVYAGVVRPWPVGVLQAAATGAWLGVLRQELRRVAGALLWGEKPALCRLSDSNRLHGGGTR